MATVDDNTRSLTGTHFATILSARSRSFVGVFKVLTACIRPYREQRTLSHVWTRELKEKLEGGIDRAAHPLKVLLGNDNMLPALEEALQHTEGNRIPWLPQTVEVFVYEGQHRVAACNLLQDDKAHWWYAEVYRHDLSQAHPAEVLSMMFLSNEKPIALPNDDATRFIMIYRLRQLLDNNKITQPTYDTSLKRLTNAIENANTRQGLRNIMRSKILSKAIAGMLEQPFLAPCFNGQTWGKKLVKGRFYALVACLVQEMTTQCMLLQDGSPDVDSKPFELTPQACSWARLKSSSRENTSHIWKALKGGITGAIERVSKRPGGFVTPLNPSGAAGWTLSDRVLLPSVLTSAIIENTLVETYQVAQHLIHMVAGPDYLAKYIANVPHVGDDDHPAGIITRVLGRSTNVTDRIICHMWHHREALLNDLSKMSIEAANETTRESYSQLLQHSQEWWALLHLFKKHCLDTGLIYRLVLPEVFKEPQATMSETPDVRAQPAQFGSQEDVSQRGAELPIANGQLTGREDSREQGQRVDMIQSPFNALSEPLTLLGPVSPQKNLLHTHKTKPGALKHSRVAKRSRLKNPDYDEDDYISNGMVQVGIEEPPRKQFRCHGAAISRLQKLETYVPKMPAREARALDDLIQTVIDLQGTSHSARVFESLSAKIQSLKNRATKASVMSGAYDNDEEDEEGEGHQGDGEFEGKEGGGGDEHDECDDGAGDQAWEDGGIE